MALRDAYQNLNTDLSNNDADWVEYIRDHYTTIVNTGGWIALDKFKHNTMKYRLEDFLQEEGMDTSIAWIILLINQLGSNINFINLTKLLLPDMKVIRRLREQYVSLNATFRKARL